MKVKIIHSDLEALDRITKYAKQLLQRTLESYQFRIRSVVIKLSSGTGIALGKYDYHCIVQIFITQGHKIKTEARDCDEILAIYQAVDKAKNIIENQQEVKL